MYLIISKAREELAMMAESPAIAAIICTIQPAIIPNEETMPALLPCEVLRAITYNMSLPGVRLSINAVSANTQKLSIDMMRYYEQMKIT